MTRIISNSVMALIAGVILCLLSPLAMAADKKAIVLDAGHGGYDTGIIVSGLKEKDLTLEIAKALKGILEAHESKVWLTRKIDQSVSIGERRSEAVKASPRLFIGLHMSESDSLAVYVNWYMKADDKLSIAEYYNISSAQRRYIQMSKKFSRVMGRTLANALEVQVDYRNMPLELLSAVAAPAIMIELPATGIEYSERLADVVAAILLGIEEYEQGR